jgi:hypothetical protein
MEGGELHVRGTQLWLVGVNSVIGVCDVCRLRNNMFWRRSFLGCSGSVGIWLSMLGCIVGSGEGIGCMMLVWLV